MNPFRLSSSSSSSSLSLFSRTFLFIRLHISSSRFDLTRSLHFSNPTMPKHQRKNRNNELSWQVKSRPNEASASASAQEAHNGQIHDPVPPSTIIILPPNQNRGKKQKVVSTWRAKSYGTTSGLTGTENKSVSVESGDVAKDSVGSSKISRDSLLANFTVDDSTYLHAQIRATFYPKFENEKSDQEVRTRMIEIVSKGVATLEVSLKHSGSLFMYAGHEGGAYAKNSFGNIYTAVGVFVLGRMFHEAWGTKAGKKQAEFNEFLEHNRMCISMELVTAVLGDHGQRPKEDYVVVTAVTELGNGKPKFYSTPQIIAFCRKWRLPTNHVWLFSTRKSVTSLFAAYDALYEEGTASSVCKALDEVADISVSGSIDHIKVQGDILEGLVARIVSRESTNYMEEVLRDFPSPLMEKQITADSGPSLREICAANRSNEKQQVKALLQSVGTSFCPDQSDWFGDDYDNVNSKNADRSVFTKILQAHPADYSTKKLQEMVSLMSKKRFPAAFKCHHNFHKTGSTSSENLFIKMVIHVRSDSAFKRYNKLMSHNPDLWPLYRGFFVDINLFKANKDKAAELAKTSNHILSADASRDTSGKNDLADEDANLMIKLKFLTYKLRTFLIRNGLSTLFKDGPASYKAYYMRQLKLWGTSAEKQKELIKLLDEWAVYIRRKYGTKQLSSSIYLSEAEPFLEQYAKRSPENRVLIGSTGNLIRAEDFLALVEGGRDEEGDLERETEVTPSSPSSMVKETVPKKEGLVVFFPGIPGCAKSALCKEITSAPGRLRDDRPVRSLMGDLIKGKYWQKVVEELKRKPYSIILADKNAPDEQVWTQIEDMCRSTRSSAVPVVADSEGTDSNPFSLDALAVFMFRVLQRDNHPGKLDKATPFAGYVLLLFYNLYEGKRRREFEAELVERFGSIVKMPLLKPDRNPLPGPLESVLEEGINLFDLHTSKHGRKDPTKGTYTTEWIKWEKCLRDVLSGNAPYLNSIQVPFEFAVEQVLEQLRNVAKGECKMPCTEKRKSGNIIFAAIDLPVTKIEDLLNNIAKNDPKLEAFLAKIYKDNLKKTHVTLAHKGPHGVTAVANFGMFLHQNVPVEMTALFFTDKMAALEVRIGSIDGEKIISKNEWPHITLWTAKGVVAKLANTLPQLFSEDKATCIQIDPPVSISGIVEFY